MADLRVYDKPYSTVDSEVCVPFKWITLAKKTNDIVSVAYPAEYSPSTREMVRKICPQQNDWRYYKVRAKCGKQSFKEAEKYIKSQNKTESEKTECSNSEINENKSVFHINTRSSNQSSSPGSTTKKHRTNNLILRNNRNDPVKLSIKRPMPNISYKDIFKKRTKTVKTPELMSEAPNHSNKLGKNYNKNKLVSLDLDLLNQEQHDTTDVKMSIVLSNTFEQTVLESSAENESSSIPTSQSYQPLTDIHKQNLPTVIIHSPNEQSQESDVRNNDKLITIDERPDCRNSSTSEAAEQSTKFKSKSSMPLKYACKDPNCLPFWNNTHPTVIKQIQLTQRSNNACDMDLIGQLPKNTNTPAQNSTDQSRYLSNQSHQHQALARYTDSLHHNLQSQNRPKPSSAKVEILEDKIIMSSYSKAANPSLEVSNTSYNNQHQRKTSIERSRNANNNDQQMCPNSNAITSPSALYRLREIITQHSHLPNHVHDEQLLPIKEMDSYQEPCLQEILDSSTEVNPIYQSAHPQIATHQERCTQEILNRSTGVNTIDQSVHPQIATHQEPCTQETLHRTSDVNRIEERACSQSSTHQEARTQIVIHKSTEVNPAEQSDSSQCTIRKIRSRRIKPISIKVIPISFCMKNSSYNEKKRRFGVRKLPIFIENLNEKGFAPVHENHSHEKVSPQNINSGKSIKIDDVDQNSQHSEIRQNTPSTVHNTSSSSNQSSCLWNGSSGEQISPVTQDQSISEPRHPSTNQQVKKSCTKNLSSVYEHYMQEKFSPFSKDFVDREMPTEITVEKTTENNKIDTCPEINTEQKSKVPNFSASFDMLPEVKSLVEECLLKVFKNKVKKIKLTIANEFPENCNYNTFGQLNEAIEQMLNTTDRYFNMLKNNVAEPVSQEPPVKPEETSANNKNKKSNNVELNYVADDDDDHDNDDNSNDNDTGVDNKDREQKLMEMMMAAMNLQKKKRGSKRSFVLPPEYDAHNSRWTLKYHAIEPGVVELTPHSKIYVSSLKLANCKRVAKDYKTLGRLLLVEIFSRTALSVCSLTGAKANAFDVHESDTRPGLDKEARSILLTYVENYGRKQGWGPFDTNAVVNSLRSKIQETRTKYGSTV